MKAVVKLLFVALLIAATLSLPNKVRAGGTNYVCNWEAWGQFYGQLNEWMAQCAYDCTEHGGSYSQVCYNTTYRDCPMNPGDYTCTAFASTYTDCYQTNNPSCISQCASSYNDQYQGYLSANCTPE
jgi:hypothetical protein